MVGEAKNKRGKSEAVKNVLNVMQWVMDVVRIFHKTFKTK
jgi:hypothetical protein